MSDAFAITDPSDFTPTQRWGAEIEAAEKELNKSWKRGTQAVSQYIDERDTVTAAYKWFNVFYANTQILESALYAQLPKPAVSRRYQDYNDNVAQTAALIIERCITQDLDDPRDNFDAVMRAAVQDRLVPGIACAWLRLETDTEELSVPPTPGADADELETDDVADSGMPKKITDQRVVVDYVYWKDFLWSPCRVWTERRWIARKAYMTRAELVERFGASKGNACPLHHNPSKAFRGNDPVDNVLPKEEVIKTGEVYEIWDRIEKKVYWYAKGMTELLDEQEDFLHLTGFEPCPEPMLANNSTSNTTPRPDYYMIQDQYNELDNVNNRISMLIQACKVVGVYDQTAKGISRMLTEGYDNQLIPVDNWAMFAEKNGLKGAIDWLPLETVTQALNQLSIHREAIKGQIYELTGIADIVRGASKASETLGAQQIKAQFASVRIKKLQDEVARFAQDIMRIKAELMVKHFEPEFLVQKSNIMATGAQELIGPAIDLLKTEEGFEWRIQISADTLAQADYAMEKSDRLEFMNVFSKYSSAMLPMLQSAPGTATMFVNILKWTVGGFRNARSIEVMLDRELDILEADAKKPKAPPPPTPEQQKLAAEGQQAQEQHQMGMQKAQMEAQMAQQQAAMEAQVEQQKAAMEAQRLQMEMEMERQRLAMEFQMEQQREQAQLQFEQLMAAIKLKAAEDQAEVKLETMHEQAAIQKETAKSKSGNGAAN